MFSIFYLDVPSSFKSQKSEIIDTINKSYSSINENVNESIDSINHIKNCSVQKKLKTNKIVNEFEKSDDQNFYTVIRQKQGKIVFFYQIILFLKSFFKKYHF